MKINWKEYAPQDIFEAVNSAPKNILGKWLREHWNNEKVYNRYNFLGHALCQVFENDYGYHWFVDGASPDYQYKPGEHWEISGETSSIKSAKQACDRAARKHGWVLV